jgi:D-alanine-D-alanine ligase-like ATP-grasp enzyme
MLGIPLVGSGAWTAFITQDKTLTAHHLQQAALPVLLPASLTLDGHTPLSVLQQWLFEGPWIVKPNNEDSSRGIDETSICTSPAEVAAKSDLLLDRWGPVRIEKYIKGYDISANLACDDSGKLIPLAPVVIDSDVGIATGSMKNNFPGSPAKRRAPLSSMSQALSDAVMQLTPELGRVLRFRHYARFDLRLDTQSGQLYFLEANICPTFEPEDDYVYGAELTGITFPELIRRILSAAHLDARSLLPSLL